MQQMIFIADLIACSTCFRHHYAHHQELKSIIQMVAACGICCLVFKLSVWCGAEGYVSGLRAAAPKRINVKQNTDTINAIFALLECCAAYICTYLPFGTTYRPEIQASSIRLVVSYQRFGTTYRSRNVGNYQFKLRNIPQGRRSYTQCSLSLKSRKCHQPPRNVIVNKICDLRLRLPM